MKKGMKKRKKINLEKVAKIIIILAMTAFGIYAVIHRIQEVREMNISLFEFLFTTMR